MTETRRHIAGVHRSLVLVVGLSLGCGSSPIVMPRQPAIPVRGVIAGDGRPAGTLYRDELERAIRRGLGHFLQNLDLRAVTREDDLAQVTFVGFEIVAMRPAWNWLAFDFAPGDIVTKIDGVSVEHYDAVLPMFEGLASKDHFDVELVRGGQRKVVTISIRRRSKLHP